MFITVRCDPVGWFEHSGRGALWRTCATLQPSLSPPLRKPDGRLKRNSDWCRRLVLQGLGWGVLSADRVTEEDSSAGIPGALFRRGRDQYFVLWPYQAGACEALGAEGRGQSELCLYGEAAPVVYAFAAGGDGADLCGVDQTER